MDLRLPKVWCVGSVGMLVGLLLVCVNVQAMPAAGAVAVGAIQVVTHDSGEDGEVLSVDPGEGSPDTVVISDRERRLKKRLLTVAVLGGLVLLLLTVVYGYFRLELTTRGFYSGRLQVLSGIASLAVATAAYFLWRWLVR